MDLHDWVGVLRLPIEIVAACLAVMPSLLLLRAWSSLPDEVPVQFGIGGRPERSGARWQAWLIPLVALTVYGTFTQGTGAWNWMLGGQTKLPSAMNLMLLMRLPIGLLMTYITWGTIHVAHKEAEALNPPVLWVLILLILGPVILQAFMHH
jgi:hypothetical protein